MTRVRWSLVLLTIAALAGAVYYLRTQAEAAAPRLATAVVTEGPVAASVEATGTLQPVDTVEVGTQVTGIVQTLAADFNSTVKAGQVIATLDPAVLQSQIDQADATVARLRAEVDRARVQVTDASQKLARARALDREGLVSRVDLDAAEVNELAALAVVRAADAQLAQADAARQQSRVNLSHTIIRAPVDGIVLSRNVEVGQTVAAGLQAPTLFIIARDLSTMQLQASVAESDIGSIRPGQAARFSVDAYPGESFKGTLRQVRLQPVVTQNVVSYTAIVDVPNPSLRLKPGMTATVRIETARVDHAVRVPASALRFRPSDELIAANGGDSDHARPTSASNAGTRETRRTDRGAGAGRPRATAPAAEEASALRPATVWMLTDGGLEAVPVEAGISDGTLVQVVGDLRPGTTVVTGAPSTAAVNASSSSSSSPLLPSMPRRNGTRQAARGR